MTILPEFLNEEVPVTLTFKQWTLAAAALVACGLPEAAELASNIRTQVVEFSREVHGA